MSGELPRAAFVLALIGLVLLVLASAFFSATEMALISLNKIRLRHLVNAKAKHAELTFELIRQLDRVITTVLVGNTLVNVTFSAVGTFVFVAAMGPEWGLPTATVSLSAFLLLFGEITPKLLAVRHSEAMALGVAPVLAWVIRLFSPLVGMVNRVTDLFMGPLGSRRNPMVTEEEIRLMIELGREHGVLADDERRMLHRIFEFGDLLVRDVMQPREEIVAIELHATAEELLDCFVEEGHSRIPVYEGTLDAIRGTIYAHDLLYLWRHKGLVMLPDLLRPTLFVPERQRVSELLRDFQRLRTQIAIVVDAEGKTRGLVTLEDLLEEIVGEIKEEVEAPWR